LLKNLETSFYNSGKYLNRESPHQKNFYLLLEKEAKATTPHYLLGWLKARLNKRAILIINNGEFSTLDGYAFEPLCVLAFGSGKLTATKREMPQLGISPNSLRHL